MIDQVTPRTGRGIPDMRAATAAAPLSPVRRLGRALRSAIDRLLLWQDRRRQRRDLAMLSESLLKDIGVTRLEASNESRKWPWRR